MSTMLIQLGRACHSAYVASVLLIDVAQDLVLAKAVIQVSDTLCFDNANLGKEYIVKKIVLGNFFLCSISISRREISGS